MLVSEGLHSYALAKQSPCCFLSPMGCQRLGAHRVMSSSVRVPWGLQGRAGCGVPALCAQPPALFSVLFPACSQCWLCRGVLGCAYPVLVLARSLCCCLLSAGHSWSLQWGMQALGTGGCWAQAVSRHALAEGTAEPAEPCPPGACSQMRHREQGRKEEKPLIQEKGHEPRGRNCSCGTSPATSQHGAGGSPERSRRR